jgi:signal peptidase II
MRLAEIAEEERPLYVEHRAAVDSRSLTHSRAVQWSRLLFYGGAAVVIIADQLTKTWVTQNLAEYQSIELFDWLAPILSLTAVRNTGVAFGLFPQMGSLFGLLSLVVVAAILYFRRTIPAADLRIHGALGLVSGGAVGNILDRILKGHVVDFLDVNMWPFHNWPVFNLADSAIVVGVGLLLLDTVLADWRAKRGDE